MRIKKGDIVKILAGKDKGKSGKVIKIIPQRERVMVEGVNIFKKHVRPKKQGEKGEVVDVSRPINVSNVGIICPNCSKVSRIGYKKEGDKKVRYCKKCQKEI